MGAARYTKPIVRFVTGRLRRVVYRLWFGKFDYLGKGAWISLRTEISHPENIRIGDSTQIGAYCRILATSAGHIHIGRDTYICPFTSVMDAGGYVEMGDRVTLNGCNFVTGQGGLSIGDDAMIAPMVSIVANQHTFDDPAVPIRDQPERAKGICIGKGGWMGVGATVLDGVTIGDNVVVGAHAVVTKDVSSLSVVAGVPARVLKRIGEE